MTDDSCAAAMPDAIHLAAAVAHRDPDAVAVALHRAGISDGDPVVPLLLCLADLVSDREAGPVIRLAALKSSSTSDTLLVLDELGIGQAA